MSAIIIQGATRDVRIPAWVTDRESFCNWACSEDFPEHGWFSYLRGEVWVDLSMEGVDHNQAKGIFAILVGGLVLTQRLGRYYHDRMGLSNAAADLGTEPDGMFVSRDTFQAGRVELVEGAAGTAIRLEGTPDVVLEVVSPSSVKKDTEVLRELYWQAGIPEYWLVGARTEPLTFDVLRHTARGYVATRKQGGWVRSAVLGKSFRLTEQTDDLGQPEYTLEVR
jgi:Uma2 family endonuclease